MTLRKLAPALALALLLPACSAVPSPEPVDTALRGASGPPEASYLAATETLGRPAIARSPGTDTNLGMSWETHITVNRANPLQVAVVQGSSVRLSQDGGETFAAAVNIGSSLPASHTSNGDGSLSFDGQGRLFMSFLGNPVAGGGWDVFVAQIDPVTGAVIGAPANVSDLIGMPSTMTSDKPWIDADDNIVTGSFYPDRLYVVWAVTGGNQSGEWEIWGAQSSDQGATWTSSVRAGFGWGPISPWDASTGRAWAPHVAVAAYGWVWVSYHGQGDFLVPPGESGGPPDGVSGQVPILLSDDGGVSYTPVAPAFAPGEADVTWNAQHRVGTIPDSRIWTIGSNQAWVLAHPYDLCTVYVVTADDSDNDPQAGDASNVVMASSTNCGTSWNLEIVDGGPDPGTTWQLFPTAAIDPKSAFIAVTYYDNRNAPSYPPGAAGNSQFDLMMTYRDNSGLWYPPTPVNDVPIDADLSASTIGNNTPPTYRFGEYNGVAFGECMAHMVWSGNPVVGGNADTYYDREPEAGGDVDAPTLVCPADFDIGCGEAAKPAVTGTPLVEDACDLNPSVAYSDHITTNHFCKLTHVVETIYRTWRVSDDAGNSDSCLQRIRVVDADCCK